MRPYVLKKHIPIYLSCSPPSFICLLLFGPTSVYNLVLLAVFGTMQLLSGISALGGTTTCSVERVACTRAS